MNAYKRVLVKLSGEALKGNSSSILSASCIEEVVASIKRLVDRGVEVCIVVGAGNIWRGKLAETIKIKQAEADYMGMLGTVINALALEAALKNNGVKAMTMTSFEMDKIAPTFTQKSANKALDDGYVVIFGGGTGNPYFTTDTGSSLRGIEIEADVMLKGTRVDGIYTADPEKDPTATKFQDISYDEVISRGLKVMDITATAMCRENNLPIYVFNMDIVGNLKKVMMGEEIGTYVHP